MELWEHPDARVDHLVLKASRQEVESDDTSRAFAKLNKLLVPSTAKRARGRLIFVITGYDDDSRDLWEIPQVQAWMRKLDIEWPYWFYFMDTGKHSTLPLVAFSLSKWDKVPGGKTIPPHELQWFLQRHFEAMNSLSHKLNETQEETDARSREINTYFFPESAHSTNRGGAGE